MKLIAQTDRLTLRFFEKSDLDAVYDLMSNPKVMQHSVSGPMSRAQAEQFLQNILDTYEKKGFSLWALEHNQDNKVIGFCGHFFHRLEGQDEVELAYRLNPDYWGQGFASEAAKAASIYAFNSLGLKRLISFIATDNDASIKVAENAGFQLERTTNFYETKVLVYALRKEEML